MEKIEQLITQAIGEASMCWNPKPSTQIYDSSHAKNIAENLFELVKQDKFDNAKEKDEHIKFLYNRIDILNEKKSLQIERTKIAAMAMQGLIASGSQIIAGKETTADTMVDLKTDRAIEYADALISKLKK